MFVLVHYGEIVLKGKNRKFFESMLVENIKKSFLRENISIKVEKVNSQILLYIKKGSIGSIKEREENKSLEEKVKLVLKNIPGIYDFSFVKIIERKNNDLETLNILKNNIISILKSKFYENYKDYTFSINTKRSDKSFTIKSPEVNAIIGEELYNNNFKINIKNADVKIYVRIIKDKILYYFEKHKGIGGLPLKQGKVLCLLSGGIDSSVAPYYIIRRGLKVDFLHFHTFKENKEVLDTKIKSIIKKFNKYQYESKLFLIPYHEYQLSTYEKIPYKYDLVVFKNFMLKIAEKIVKEKGYDAILTGDNLGQVASQTIENIKSTSYNVKEIILRPLIGFDKEEIILKAKEINTYEDAIKEYKDCCSIISKKPHTKVKIEKLKSILEKIDYDKIIEENYKLLEEYIIKEYEY